MGNHESQASVVSLQSFEHQFPLKLLGNLARKKEGKKLLYQHVISMVYTLIERSSRTISAREIPLTSFTGFCHYSTQTITRLIRFLE